VAILSRAPLDDVVAGIPGFEDEQKRVLAATVAGVRVIDVYVPNGQTVGSEKYEYKLRWFAALREYVASELTRHPHLVVLGDYNVAPEDRDVHDPKAWEGSVHVSEPERAALRALLATGLEDCFRLLRAAREILLVVGLPDDGVPAQRRSQNRLDPREHRAGAKMQRRSVTSTRRRASSSGPRTTHRCSRLLTYRCPWVRRAQSVSVFFTLVFRGGCTTLGPIAMTTAR
jgi:hypothetical protein